MILALTGYKQTGKTTAAEHLQKNHGFVRINFKDALVQEIKDNFPELLALIKKKQTARAILAGIPLRKAEKLDLFQTKPPLMRALMQNYGTDVRRKDRDTYWTSKWGVAVVECGEPFIICDDVRFLNEAKAVKESAGKIIRLVRPDIPSGGTHVSETEQDEIEADYTIEVGQGDLDELYKQLDAIVELHKRS